MYEQFFGCRERPFDLSPNPRYLVPTPAHREALSTLEYGISSRKGIALLIGDAGTGKTTVIRAALERQPARVHYVHLHNPALTRDEFVEMLASQFKLTERARSSKSALLIELDELLRQRQLAGEVTLLVVDEAQSLPLELLEEIRLLANIETDDEKLVSVIMAGQPELAARLNDPALRQLKQRIALRCELRPLTLDETLLYIAGRLRAAGCTTQMFTREAVAVMHGAARGIPRTVSVIADNALLSAFALGERLVTATIVLEVCRDLDIAEPDGDTAATDAGVPQATVAPAAKAPGRLLLIEKAGPPSAPSASVAPVAAPASTTSVAAQQDGGMFAGWMRRRFSFFS